MPDKRDLPPRNPRHGTLNILCPRFFRQIFQLFIRMMIWPRRLDTYGLSIPLALALALAVPTTLLLTPRPGLLGTDSEYIRIRDKSMFLVPLHDGEPGEYVEMGEVRTLFEQDHAFGGGQGFGECSGGVGSCTGWDGGEVRS